MQRSSINRVLLVGRIGNKPEGRFTASGASTASFSVATNEVWGTDEKRQEHTEWHNVTAWGKTADFVTKYIQKGQLVAVEGRLRTRSWTDKEEKVGEGAENFLPEVTNPEGEAEENAAPPPPSEGGEEEPPL